MPEHFPAEPTFPDDYEKWDGTGKTPPPEAGETVENESDDKWRSQVPQPDKGEQE
jgi:hypothetical protein